LFCSGKVPNSFLFNPSRILRILLSKERAHLGRGSPLSLFPCRDRTFPPQVGRSFPPWLARDIPFWPSFSFIPFVSWASLPPCFQGSVRWVSSFFFLQSSTPCPRQPRFFFFFFPGILHGLFVPALYRGRLFTIDWPSLLLAIFFRFPPVICVAPFSPF